MNMMVLTDWNGKAEDSRRACRDYWKRLKVDQRLKLLQHYDKLISIEEDTYDPGTYGVFAPKGKRQNDRRPYPTKMPSMYKYMKQGREWLYELMKELGEL